MLLPHENSSVAMMVLPISAVNSQHWKKTLSQLSCEEKNMTKVIWRKKWKKYDESYLKIFGRTSEIKIIITAIRKIIISQEKRFHVKYFGKRLNIFWKVFTGYIDFFLKKWKNTHGKIQRECLFCFKVSNLWWIIDKFARIFLKKLTNFQEFSW